MNRHKNQNFQNLNLDPKSIRDLKDWAKKIPRDTKSITKTTQLYNDYKNTFKNIIVEIIETGNCKPNDVLMVIDIGSDKNTTIPYLNLKKSKKDWSEERTLKQYLYKTSYEKGNIPPNVMSQTIRYLHTDPNINETEQIKEINNNDLFHPVIPNKIIVENDPEKYIILSKIFVDDKDFLANVNSAIKHHNPNYFIEIEFVQGDSSTIEINGQQLNLNNEYYKLILVENSISTEANTVNLTTYTTQANTTPENSNKTVIIYDV